MNARILPRIVLVACVFVGPVAGAADRPTSPEGPKPRPRITESLRAKADEIARESDTNRAVAMDKVVVRESRLPSGPPPEQPWEGKFLISQGGYILKKQGDRFTTEVGLWRHVDIIEDKVETLKQSTRIKMDFVRIRW